MTNTVKYLPEPLLLDLIFSAAAAVCVDVDILDGNDELVALAALLRPAVDSALTAISGGQNALTKLPYAARRAAGVVYDDMLDDLGDTISSAGPTLAGLPAEQQHRMLGLLSSILVCQLVPRLPAPWVRMAVIRQRRGDGYSGGTSDEEHIRVVRRVGAATPALQAVLSVVLCAAWEGHKIATASHPLVAAGYLAFLRSYRGGINAAV